VFHTIPPKILIALIPIVGIKTKKSTKVNSDQPKNMHCSDLNLEKSGISRKMKNTGRTLKTEIMNNKEQNPG